MGLLFQPIGYEPFCHVFQGGLLSCFHACMGAIDDRVRWGWPCRERTEPIAILDALGHFETYVFCWIPFQLHPGASCPKISRVIIGAVADIKVRKVPDWVIASFRSRVAVLGR